MSAIYLIHFDRPYRHACHYMGFTNDLAKRMDTHRAGKGARLMEVVTLAGIKLRPVRVWYGGTRSIERRFKLQHHLSRLCPLCNPGRWQQNGEIEGIVSEQ